jgi:hypothetical protein
MRRRGETVEEAIEEANRRFSLGMQECSGESLPDWF